MCSSKLLQSKFCTLCCQAVDEFQMLLEHLVQADHIRQDAFGLFGARRTWRAMMGFKPFERGPSFLIDTAVDNFSKFTA